MLGVALAALACAGRGYEQFTLFYYDEVGPAFARPDGTVSMRAREAVAILRTGSTKTRVISVAKCWVTKVMGPDGKTVELNGAGWLEVSPGDYNVEVAYTQSRIATPLLPMILRWRARPGNMDVLSCEPFSPGGRLVVDAIEVPSPQIRHLFPAVCRGRQTSAAAVKSPQAQV